MTTLFQLFAALSLGLSGVVALKFFKLWRAVRRLHQRFSFLEVTRGDARREINATAVRLAKLEHVAGLAPESVHHDMRKVTPRDFDGDELADELAEADERALLAEKWGTGEERTPHLGDKVVADNGLGGFEGEISVVDHVRRQVSVTHALGVVLNFEWEKLRFVA